MVLLAHESDYKNLGGQHALSSKVGLKGGSRSNSKNEDYELYPFLVDSKVATVSGNAVLSTITLPEFSAISRLEGCKLAYKPSDPPRTTESEWRKKFWIPSFPGAGASNPSNKGNLVRDIMEGLFSGDEGKEAYVNPIKDYHISIRNRLKRCKGVSETVGCTCNHPQTSTTPEGQTSDFRPEAIVAIRNPSTAIPAFFAYKNIAYHKATKQVPEEEWRKTRDLYFEGTFDQWMDVIKFWRGSAEESSYYSTSVYVPFEDLMTTDLSKGAATVQELSDSISGRKATNAKENGFFETSASKEDYECLWYRSAKEEWERQKMIIGDYVPAYTQAQKDKMVSGLNTYADEVERDSFKGDHDAMLVSLLRRYANQIQSYVRVEETQEAPKR